MGLIFKATLMFLIVISYFPIAEGAWQGPTEMVSGTWGPNNDQFGIEHGDTNDVFGGPFYLLLDGSLILTDLMNGRMKIYNSNGVLTKVVKCVKGSSGEWNEECRIPLVSYIQTTNDGNLWVGPLEYLKQQGYSLYSPTGQLIKTSTTRPTELGSVQEQALGDSKYKTAIAYPDRVYSFLGGPFERYVRDQSGSVNAVSGKFVKKINECGKELGKLALPENQTRIVRPGGRGFEERRALIAQFGEPVVAPNGDVYTWKRTPTNYSILKWTWVDDPNTPSGPDAPSGLTVTPSTTGIYLTWTAAPQDPGCVTGYEISRATSAGGSGTTVGTTTPGKVTFNDSTAERGTTYYYKVRAAAGTEYSPFTSEVSGRRP